MLMLRVPVETVLVPVCVELPTAEYELRVPLVLP